MSVPLAVGVDVGGTKILYALVDAQGHVVESLRRDSSYGMEPLGWVARAVQDIQALCGSQSHGHLVGVGVGFAGQVDRDNGLVQGSPNLGWKEVPLRALFQKELSLPVTVLNDVQAATWGEWRLGAGEGFSDLVCLFVGTGIGGGLILDGKLYRGASGSAGELGHMVLYPGGRACMCGRRGCLEAYAGGWAIAARAREAVHGKKTAGRHLLTLAGGDAAAVTAALVSEAAHGGDALTKTLVRQVGDDLGLGVASVVNAFNPQRLVLGGGVIEGLPELVPVVREVVSRQALAPAAARVEVVKAGLGMYGGVIGAALIAHAAVPSESVS